MAVLDSSGSNYVATTPSNLATPSLPPLPVSTAPRPRLCQSHHPGQLHQHGRENISPDRVRGLHVLGRERESNFRARIGTAGSSADNAAAVITPTAAASGTAIPFLVEMVVTVRSVGSGGSIIGGGALNNNGVTGVSAAAVVAASLTATVSLNTTVQNILQLSYVAAAIHHDMHVPWSSNSRNRQVAALYRTPIQAGPHSLMFSMRPC
jgi:hypothetical protein